MFLRCCEHYLGFLGELGVRDRVHLQPRLEVPIARPGEPLAWIRRAPLPAPAHLALSLLRLPALALEERLRAAWTARRFASLDPDDRALDEVALGGWLREQGESERAIDVLWDLLIRPTLNLSAREASLALAARVLRTGFLDTARGADVGWPIVPLRALHAEPAAVALRARGVRLETGSRVDGLELGEAPSVWVGGERRAADAIVLATPHESAARLLTRVVVEPALRTRLEGLEKLAHSPIVNLHVVFDRPVMDQPLLAVVGSELQWIFDRTRSAGLARGQYLTAPLSAADAWLGESSERLRAVFLPAFHALLPRSRAARVEAFAVTSEPTATFRAAPGTRRVRPAPGTEIAGVFLAGAWTDTGWPATMEAAVRSGKAAAQAALAACARRTREAA